MLARSAQAPMACFGRAGANWDVMHFHLLILGATKYLEKSRSSNEHRSLNLSLSLHLDCPLYFSFEFSFF